MEDTLKKIMGEVIIIYGFALLPLMLICTYIGLEYENPIPIVVLSGISVMMVCILYSIQDDTEKN